MTRGPRFIFFAISAGVFAGALAKWSDENGPDLIGDLGTGFAVWVAIVATIGWFSRSPLRAGTVSALFFLAMNTTYYAWAAFVLGYPFELQSLAWFVLAAVVCPPLSAAMNMARGRELIGPVALGAAASLVLITGPLQQIWLKRTGALAPFAPDRTAEGVLNVIMAIALTLFAKSPRGVAIAFTTAVLLYWPIQTLFYEISMRLPLP